VTNEIEPGSQAPSGKPAQSVKASRWAMSVPVGVIVSFGAGLVLSAIVGAGQPSDGWQTNVGGAAILLVGSLATGTVAGARTSRDWVRAVILTFAAILAIVVSIFAYVAGTEPPR
jgi:hypothetical protein